MLTKQDKSNIAQAARKYMEANNMSQNSLAEKALISAPYLSAIMSAPEGEAAMLNNVAIKDKYYLAIKSCIGLQFENERKRWSIINTPQLNQLLIELTESKQDGTTKVITCEPGAGKSFGLELFANRYPNETYTIKISSMHRIGDIINDAGDQMRAEYGKNASKQKKLAAIIIKLRELKRMGKKPILIVDESENMDIKTMGLVKGLFDGVKDYCSIVLIGTPDLLGHMEKAKTSTQTGGAQFYRRFKAGITPLPEIDKHTYNAFFDSLEINDEALRKAITSKADNYGELYDYCTRLTDLCEREGLPMNATTFRQLFY